MPPFVELTAEQRWEIADLAHAKFKACQRDFGTKLMQKAEAYRSLRGDGAPLTADDYRRAYEAMMRLIP